MERINSNNVDIYHPDYYCGGEEYEGVNYPDAYLGERIINLNGCEGRKEGEYGISTRRCELAGWSEPKYYCTSSISNLETTIQKSAADTKDDEKYEFAYNTHQGPLINTTFVYNRIHQRGGEEALLNYYNNIITTSNTTDLIYEPERYCKINYGAGHDLYINNHSDRVYALINSNGKYMYVTCTQGNDNSTTLNIVHESPSNMFTDPCARSGGWTYSAPIFKRTCNSGTQYGYCKDGSIESINDIDCGKEWKMIILIIIIAIVIVIVIIVIRIKKRKNNGNTINNESE